MEERKYTLKNPIQAKQTVEVRVSHGAVWVGLWLVHGKRLETSPRIPFRRGPLTGRPVWKNRPRHQAATCSQPNAYEQRSKTYTKIINNR